MFIIKIIEGILMIPIMILRAIFSILLNDKQSKEQKLRKKYKKMKHETWIFINVFRKKY